MDEQMDRTKTTIKEFSKSVSKLNLYSDRLILEAEKSCVMSNCQLRPSDEKIVIETTQQAIKFILQYAELLDTIKQVEQKKKTVPDVKYPEFKEATMKTLDNLKTDVLKLKLFREYSGRTIESLSVGVEQDSVESSSSCDNSYSFS